MNTELELNGEAFVKALWDEDEQVYYSESNIPGLFIEAESLGEFEKILFDVAGELIIENIVKPQLAEQGFDCEYEHGGSTNTHVPYAKLPTNYPFVWQGAAPRHVNLAVA
jgi:hypothetical protein